MSARAIETHWRGYRFRSRTEARWAVLFASAKIAFDYEPEGFSLPSGPYLPDFWLPDHWAWLEVKGAEPNDAEIRKAVELAIGTKRQVFIAVGAPDPDKTDLSLIGTDGGHYEARLTMPNGDWIPRSAFDAARRERFDGSSNTPPKGGSRQRWW